MDQAYWDMRVEVLRRKRPEMFLHPQARPGEIYLMEELADWTALTLAKLQVRGMESARIGKEVDTKGVAGWKVACFPVLVNAREYLECIDRERRALARAAPPEVPVPAYTRVRYGPGENQAYYHW